MDVASYSQFPFICYVGVSHHHPPSIITHSLVRARLGARKTWRARTKAFPGYTYSSRVTPEKHPATHVTGKWRLLDIEGVVLPIQPSCVRAGSKPDAARILIEARKSPPRPHKRSARLQRSCGSGGGVAIGLAGLQWLASPGPLCRWPPGTPPKSAVPEAAWSQVRTLRQQRLLEMLPPREGLLRFRSAWPRFP